MNKNKNISIKPSKGISIVIKNDFQPEVKPKKKRRYKKKINLDKLKMPTMPSYIPQGDVSYIKPQYPMSSLNRNIIFPGVPQSLPPPPQLPQILPPPQLPQIMPPPPQQQPINISFDNMFGGLNSMMMNSMMDSMMPREYGFKSNSYTIESLDDDIMDALPTAEKDKYIETKMKPQIEQEIKDITFPNEAKKEEFITNAISIKTAKEYGTKHANKLIAFDSKYNGNEYYKTNYISRLQEIVNQDSIKTRGGIKENTQENKSKAKELLKAMGIKTAISVAVPEYKPPPSPERPKSKAIVSSPKPKPSEIEEEKPAPATIKPTPPPIPSGKGPPPPPPPPAAATNAIEKDSREKMLQELKDKVENDDPEERLNKKEASSKTQGTKDGKKLMKIKIQWINYIGYRDNYEQNLKAVRDNDSTSKDDKKKAEELLKILDEQYKRDASVDMPNPTTTTKLKINKPRFTTNEAYKKEYKKIGNKLLKKIKESAVLDAEDEKNIKLIEDYFKLFD